MNILIIEDEQLAVYMVSQQLRRLKPNAQIIGIKDSVASSVEWLTEHAAAPDLIIMDIGLADGQSFDIFDQTSVKCPVIFLTSHEEYALKAFALKNSLGYLLKPVKKEELEAALAKFDHMMEFFKYRQDVIV
ncbi:LytR/AlgR family response regulator transcription factor [Parapedobacter koreensis]|uniref:Response regulator receiver domain-containing protein n=1 Tax=Parapedobacter koreensis TaxID=332977 RepID=A0A1H7TK67_9SPHI|nr:response regulator [Parapedobacter koreensis]SEL84726.1 Response regulator receiver domain-containing protein [Parapedobacter koreensis]